MALRLKKIPLSVHSISCAVFCATLLVSQSAGATTLPWLPKALADPFATEKKASNLIAPRLHPEMCPSAPNLQKQLSPNDVVAITLCNNPDTRSGYLSLMGDAANFGASYAAYLPSVSAEAGWSKSTSFTPKTEAADGSIISFIGTSESISAGMTLYDFGRREASFDAAEQTLIAAGHNYDSSLQGAIAGALDGYYRLLAAQEAVDVAEESERYAKESYDAAQLKHTIGQAPIADELQAKGAYSEAQLATEQVRNQLYQARVAMALTMGLKPDTELNLAEVNDSSISNDPFGGHVQDLIEQAQHQRYDLIASRDQIESQKASLRALERSDLPSIGISAGESEGGKHFFDATNARSQSIGFSVSMPIFTGFTQTYNERAARDQLKSQQEQLRKSELNVAQDVWNAWHNYETAKQSWQTSYDLMASALKLKEVALGRYTEGLGTILDVLSAESQYTSALESQLQSHYNLLTTRIDLVRAVGVLDLDTMHATKPIDVPVATSATNH